MKPLVFGGISLRVWIYCPGWEPVARAVASHRNTKRAVRIAPLGRSTAKAAGELMEIRSNAQLYLNCLECDRAIQCARMRDCQEENQFTCESLVRSARLFDSPWKLVHPGFSPPALGRCRDAGISSVRCRRAPRESRQSDVLWLVLQALLALACRARIPRFSVGWKTGNSGSPYFGIVSLKRLSRARRRLLPLSRETLNARSC